MIKNVTIPARECSCHQCGYTWITLLASPRMPTHCMNKECRSREWNGTKVRKAPEKNPEIVLPKPVRIHRGEDEDGSTY